MSPTKRDILLCLSSFLLAWALFGSTHSGTSLADSRSGTTSIIRTKGAGLEDGDYEETRVESTGMISRIGKFVPSFSNGLGWFGGKTTQGHSAGNIGLETVCEVGASGEVRVHGYSDSVAKHPLVLSAVDSVDNDADSFDEADAPGLTRLIGHQPGWTIFENLYLCDGTLWVVTDDASSYPEMRLMTSTGLPANGDPGNEEAREPKGDELMYITPRDAREKWGDRIWEMEGVTWLFNDGQFIDHYYHFAAELFLGIWRTYASLGTDFGSDGSTTLPAPARSWFIRMTEQTWRDKPRFNSAILWSAFPSMSVLYQDDWADIKRSTSSGAQKAYLFPRAILADRSAAFRGPHTAPVSRTVASAMMMSDPGPWWWEPIRRQVLRFAGVNETTLDFALEGYGAIDPVKFATDPDLVKELTPPSREIGSNREKQLVTYISRQSSRRRLTTESHEDLVQALEKHSKAKGWELLIVEAEKLTKEEQLQIAARTTIMLGVHGNGLTHLLWMPPTPRSAVIEMFFPGGFARDYQWTAQNLGIRHFAIRHDTVATAPHEPKVDYPEGFQGTSITVVGEIVAQLIDDRLDGKL